MEGARRIALPAALRAVGLARSTWYYQTRNRVSYAEKYAHLEAPLKAIAGAHPEYGYRRATTELRETYGHRVNRKVVERLHRLWDLPLRRARRPRPSAIRRVIGAARGRANLLSRRGKPEIGALEVIYTDFTELRFAGGVRKAWLIPLLDHATRYVPSFAVGERANSGLERGGADPDALPRLVRGRGRPPGPGPGVHRLRMDRPAPGGRGAASEARLGSLRGSLRAAARADRSLHGHQHSSGLAPRGARPFLQSCTTVHARFRFRPLASTMIVPAKLTDHK